MGKDKKEIIIDGIKYVPQYELDALNKGIKNDGIMDVANVSMLVKLPKEKEKLYTFNKSKLSFKEYIKLCDCKIDIYFDVFYIKGLGKYSYEFIKHFNKMLSGLKLDKRVKDYSKGMTVYGNYKDDSFIADYPILLVYDDYGLILAPRVDNN